jgi:hypothetical protein
MVMFFLAQPMKVPAPAALAACLFSRAFRASRASWVCAAALPWASWAYAAALPLASWACAAALPLASGCASTAHASGAGAAPLAPVAPAPPPKDDGSPAKGGDGGPEHAAALEQLKTARLDGRTDRQNSVRVLLPDAPNWLRVKFWGVKSLVGFRYGKSHHAIVGGFVIHVPDETAPGACGKAFEDWAQPYADAFEVEIAHDAPKAFPWNGKIVDVDSLVATTATLGDHDQYAAVYATYPVWPKACLILGIAIPARNELERAKAVRDRFAAEVLPKVQVTAPAEPKESY